MQSTPSYRDVVTKGLKRRLPAVPPAKQPPLQAEFSFDFGTLAFSDTPPNPPTEPILLDGKEWASGYSDPKAKIILVSLEGVHYRFHTSQMSIHSALIQHLYTLTKQDDNDNQPIETDCPNLSLRIFAHYITHTHTLHNTHLTTTPDSLPTDHLPNLEQLPTSYLIDLLALSDRFQMTHHFETTILHRLSLRAIDDPWTVFIVACARRDIILARRAIAQFGVGYHIPANRLHDIKPFEVAGLPMEYMLELMKLRLGGGEVDYPMGGTGDVRKGHVLVTWGHVARVFMKERYVEPKTGKDGKKIGEVGLTWRTGKTGGKNKVEKVGRSGRSSASKTK